MPFGFVWALDALPPKQPPTVQLALGNTNVSKLVEAIREGKYFLRAQTSNTPPAPLLPQFSLADHENWRLYTRSEMTKLIAENNILIPSRTQWDAILANMPGNSPSEKVYSLVHDLAIEFTWEYLEDFQEGYISMMNPNPKPCTITAYRASDTDAVFVIEKTPEGTFSAYWSDSVSSEENKNYRWLIRTFV